MLSHTTSSDPHQKKRLLPVTSERKIGFLCALLTGLLAALMMTFIHNAKQDFSAADVLTYRSLTFIAFALPFCAPSIGLLFKRQAALLWLRGGFACGALFLLFYATQQAPIGLVSALFAATPLIVYLIARVVLKETMTARHAIGCAVVGGGIVLMATSPGVQGISTTIVGLCLVAMLLRACSFVTLRAGSSRLPTMHIILVLSICTAAIGMVMGADLGHIAEHGLNHNLLGVGITSAFMQWFLTISYKKLPAGEAALYDQSEVLWAVLFGYVFHSYSLTATEWVAGMIIVGGAIWSQTDVFSSTRTSGQVRSHT